MFFQGSLKYVSIAISVKGPLGFKEYIHQFEAHNMGYCFVLQVLVEAFLQ